MIKTNYKSIKGKQYRTKTAWRKIWADKKPTTKLRFNKKTIQQGKRKYYSVDGRIFNK